MKQDDQMNAKPTLGSKRGLTPSEHRVARELESRARVEEGKKARQEERERQAAASIDTGGPYVLAMLKKGGQGFQKIYKQDWDEMSVEERKDYYIKRTNDLANIYQLTQRGSGRRGTFVTSVTGGVRRY